MLRLPEGNNLAVTIFLETRAPVFNIGRKGDVRKMGQIPRLMPATPGKALV
jgi:hypothetical protein